MMTMMLIYPVTHRPRHVPTVIIERLECKVLQ